ncbi:MAG: hypothetical protein FWC68_01230, partial [Oscillospiraceae bacterium]|nr:hypothetical protein [Oscillospiraceae bacterium]
MFKKILTTCILTIMILQSIGSAVIATVEIVQNVQEETYISEIDTPEENNVGADDPVCPEIEPETPPIDNDDVGAADPCCPNSEVHPKQPEAQPLEPISITPANLGPPITFARQGQSQL